MRTKLLSIVSTIACLAASALLALPARAATIAGWDFSQWAGDNALITNRMTFAFEDTLDANYSSADPTFNAGAESAAFGTLYFDGQFGSTNVDEAAPFPAFAPTAGSLSSNLDGPVQGPGDNPFDSHTILQSEGQDFTNLLGMTAAAPLSVVFEADLYASGRSVTFGGKTFSGASTLGIEFSKDGSTYTNVGTANLTTTDTPFAVPLKPLASSRAFVRFSFDATAGQPIIDNVAIQGSTLASAVIVFKNLHRPGFQGITVKGFTGIFNPATVAFEDNGAAFALETQNGTVYDLTVPGGEKGIDPTVDNGHCSSLNLAGNPVFRDGWTRAIVRGVTVWTYLNRSGAFPPDCAAGSAQGLTKIVVKDLTSKAKGAFLVKVVTAKDPDDLPAQTFPVQQVHAEFAEGGPGRPPATVDIVSPGIAPPRAFCKEEPIGATDLTREKIICKAL
jgi:hypothetical protein